MITRPIVFILGAGASFSFGYPLGKNLVDIILKNFDPSNKENAIEIFKGLGFSEDEIHAFRDQLRLSAAPSIDNFLEPRHEEERYLGKLAIAYALIPFEKTDTLFCDSSWYVTFINKLQPKFEDFEKNKLSFITFNYDRSLEHFLVTTLMNRFKKSEQEVAEKIKKIPIVHLYGKLGLLPWEKHNSDNYTRDYNSNVTPHFLRKSSKSLKIIYDKVEPTDPDFKQAKQLIKVARKIYFLGFGFHKDNLDRLNIKSLLINNSMPPIIEATSYKLSPDLKESVPKYYKIKFPNHDWDINQLIEQKIRLE
jgi:hypothetical protein